MFTRRRFLKTGTLAGGALLAPTLATRTIAQVTLPGGTLTTVSDGYLSLPEAFVLGDLPADEARAIITGAGYDLQAYQSPCNLTLWQSEGRNVLFDAGSGPDFMPNAGDIAGSLEALGLSLDDITHVIFTHGHPDHLWGATDDFDEPTYYNAAYHMGGDEHAYWSDANTVNTIDEGRQAFAAGALRRLELLEGGVSLFGAGDELVPGVTAVGSPGHTPGHMSFRVGGEGGVFVIGDAIANSHLALKRPDWTSPSDQDPELGLQTRQAMLEQLAGSGETVVGFHFKDGGIGIISRDGDAYTFAPAA